MAPFDPNILEEFLAVLEGRGIERFECELFKIRYFGEPEPAESTDVRGFVVPSRDDDDDHSPDELKKQHSRAFGSPMPLLNPKQPKKE
jgi:hypothetical protein